MKKDGFTLPQLLTLIGIVIVLIIAAIPISKHLLKKKREEKFLSQINEIYNLAKKDYKEDIKKNEGHVIYYDSTNEKRLLSENDYNLYYYIAINTFEEVVYFYVSNGYYYVDEGYINSNTEIDINDFGLPKSNKKYVIKDPSVNNVELNNKVNDGTEIVRNKNNSVSGYLLGDVNRDKIIDEKDIDMINYYIDGEKKLSEEQRRIADVNKDGKLTISDINEIKRYIIGNSSVYDYYRYADSTGKRDGTNIALKRNNSYSGFLFGDVNRDGILSQDDIELIEKYIKSKKGSKLDNEQIKLCDINKDNNVDNADVLQLKKYIAGVSSIYDRYDLLDSSEVKIVYDGGNILKLEAITYNDYLYGDVNKDNKLNEEDISLIKEYIGDRKEFTDEQKKLADVDQNKRVTLEDTNQIYRYINGKKSVYTDYCLSDDSKFDTSTYKGPTCSYKKGQSVINDGIEILVQCVDNGFGCEIVDFEDKVKLTDSKKVVVKDRGIETSICDINVESYYKCSESEEETYKIVNTFISKVDLTSKEEFKKTDEKKEEYTYCNTYSPEYTYICRTYKKQYGCEYTYYFK